MPSHLPERSRPLSWRETARLAALTVRLWRLNHDLAAAHRRVERRGTEAAGDELLRVARLWLTTQDAIRALIGGPEPPHVAGVRASLGLPPERSAVGSPRQPKSGSAAP